MIGTGNSPVVIYRITNLVNGKIYIGLTTKDVRRRWTQHVYEGRRGLKGRLYAAMRRYGVELFRLDVLKYCQTLPEAKSEERRLIAIWRPQYNHSEGGEGASGNKMPRHIVERIAAKNRGRPGTFTGKKHTPEAIAKMRDFQSTNPKRHLPRKPRPGVGAKALATKRARGTVPKPWLGKKRSEETKRKISASKTGVPRPSLPEAVVEIFRENMRRAARARRKEVMCLDDGSRFLSCADAERHYGFSRSTVGNVANGKTKSIHGLRFSFIEDGQ